MRFKFAWLALFGLLTAFPSAHAGVQYVFGIDNLVGRTSTNGTLSGMTVRIGKFAPGFTPSRLNYDSWQANFISLLPGTETLVSDAASFLTPAAPDTGPWTISNNRITINAGAEPAGFVNGDQLYLWISNATTGSAVTQAALLTDPSWTYVTATNEPQPDVTLALQDEAPTLVVGNTFDDAFVDGASETGIRLVMRHIPVPSPQIAVEGPDETALEDEVSTVSFGSIPNFTFVTKDLRITNEGNLNLTGITASITGADASAFNFTTIPAASVTPQSEGTMLSIAFAPTTVGVKNAILHIESNDPAISSFDIALTGTGVAAPGTVAINLPAGSIIPVVEGSSATIPIIRSGGFDGTLNFTITTIDGSAKASLDFTPPTASQSIGNGMPTTSVTILTSNPPSTSEANETFTVNLTGATVTPGGTTSVTVRIIDSADSSKPVPTVSKPLSNALEGVSTDGPLTVKGNATDNRGVVSVKVKLNDGLFHDAILVSPGATTTAWQIDVTPKTGTNTLSVEVQDTLGNNSLPFTRTFIATRPLTVTFDSSKGSISAGYTPNPTYRKVGKSYTITATPKITPAPGAIFAGWTLEGEDEALNVDAFTPQRLGMASTALEKQTITFLFREGLELHAHFEDSPYDSSVTGTYNGLVHASPALPDRPSGPDGSVPGIATEGHFTATVMATGAFSGKLTIDGFVLNVAGTFDHQGRARFGTTRALTQVVARPNKPSLLVKLDIGGPPGSVAALGTITGQVTATEFQKNNVASVSTVDAERAHFTGLSEQLTVPDAYLTVTGSAPAPTGRTDGTFTVVLPAVPLPSQPTRMTSIFTERDYPQGDGVGTIKVTKAGAISLVGTLADGTAVTASGTLSQNLRTALFAQLYTLKGFFSAPVQLDSAQADSDMKPAAGRDALWCRPFINTSQYFPYGWAETLEVGLLGAKYTVPAAQSALRAANGADLHTADTDGNVTITFSDGSLDAALIKSANLSTADVVTKVPVNDPTFTLSVARTTGKVSGTFTHTDDTTAAFNAIIFQKGPNAGAYGYFLTKQPTPIDYTGQSGGVSIIGQP